MRLDEYVAKKYKFSLNKSRNLIKHNRVLINNCIETDKTLLIKNQIVTLFTPNTHKVIFENANMVIVHKYAGFAVARTVNTPAYDCVVNENINCTLAKTDYPEEFGLIHRIDKDTSGLLMLVKSQDLYDKLRFNSSIIYKEYLAFDTNVLFEPTYNTFICKHGCFIVTTTDQCKCDVSRNIIHIGMDVKPSINIFGTRTTTYISRVRNGFICGINGGKKHQIRLLLNHLSYPIWGDKLYNHNKTSDIMNLYANYLSIPACFII